jgi:hypothetical protein
VKLSKKWKPEGVESSAIEGTGVAVRVWKSNVQSERKRDKWNIAVVLESDGTLFESEQPECGITEAKRVAERLVRALQGVTL